MADKTKLWAKIKITGVEFNTTQTEIALKIRKISVYMPFDMVARYEGKKFVEVTCSCGWKYETTDEKQLLTQSKLHNHNANREYSLILRAFQNNKLNYFRALDFLKQQGMTESKAEDWLDRVSHG